MKKMLSLALSLILAVLAALSLTACADLSEFGDPAESSSGTTDGTSDDTPDTYTVTASYDYGMHRPGLATMLYNYSTLFFPLPEGYDPPVAGDEFTVTYTGQLLIQESYPSTVVITGGEIISVTAEPAEIRRVRYNVKKKRLTVLDENGEAEAIDFVNYPQYYIIDEEGHFAELSTLTEDTELYGSVSYTNRINAVDSIAFSGLYLQNPRGE